MKRTGINKYKQNVFEALIMTPLPWHKLTGKETATLFNLQVMWGKDGILPKVIELNKMISIFSKYGGELSLKTLTSIDKIKDFRRPAKAATGRIVPARSGEGRLTD